MPTRNSRIVGLPVAAVAVALVGCAQSEGAAPAAEEQVRIVNVEVTPIDLVSFTEYIRVTGEVEAMHDITLSAEETGVIERFLVPKGATVQRGQVIAELNADVLAAQVEEMRAAARLAQEEYERRRRLWEEEQIGSELAYLQTRSAAEAAAARLATYEARLARTKIRAPVAGVFDEKLMEQGEMAMPGAQIARVVAIRQVKVTGGIPERFALSIRPGQTARVTFDVFPGEEFEGRIRYVGTSVDRANRTVPIELVMDNPNGAAKPRMIANVQVMRAELDSVVVVPQQVVQRTEDGYQVYVVVEEEGHPVAEARSVTLGASYRNQVVIESGLAVGEQLVTLGQQLVDAGSRVRVVNAGDLAVDARKDSDE